MTDTPPYPGAPRWAKILGAIAIVALIALIAVHLVGGGGLAHVIDHSSMGRTTASP